MSTALLTRPAHASKYQAPTGPMPELRTTVLTAAERKVLAACCGPNDRRAVESLYTVGIVRRIVRLVTWPKI